MFLNKLAGRSFNDLMIYPVYPFVLRDYTSDVLDLSSGDSFRDLSKPMAVQKKSREKYYREQYQYLLSEYNRRLENEDATLDPVSCPVYHYGSHYSNSGTVLHFLVRLPPFTQMFLHYQDRSFDIPDRTFHSMNVTWNLSSGDSTTDFKEMIPEFFYLPEFLTNSEHFDFGKRHNGIKVNDVNLPVWCRSDPRLFVLINRQSLESDYVSKHLHQWIDLSMKPALHLMPSNFSFSLPTAQSLASSSRVNTPLRPLTYSIRQLTMASKSTRLKIRSKEMHSSQ